MYFLLGGLVLLLLLQKKSCRECRQKQVLQDGLEASF